MSGNRQKCLKGTREEVLAAIISWANNPENRHMYWLNGHAGSGKSTICQSFAEYCFAHGLLGASFFCSRDFQDRSSLDLIFPTLALGLAYRYPAFRDALIPVIKATPDAGHESLSTQLETLLIAPLKASGISTIIVIDALDECKDEQSTSAILSVLGRHIDELSSVKFFITSRPESRIHSGFNLPLLRPQTDVFLLHEVEKTSVDHDIRLYFRAQFSELTEGRKEIHFPVPWPNIDSVESLVQRAGGLFIFASTTCKFVSLRPGNPQRLLQRILDMESRSDYEGKLTLDSLYTQILVENNKTSNIITDTTEEVNAILGTTILVLDPVSLATLALLLKPDIDDILSFLSLLHSVLRVPSSPTTPISAFHKSFPDFLLDKNRCKDGRFHIDPSKHHARLAIRCLELMNQEHLPSSSLCHERRGGGSLRSTEQVHR
jgi:hypothetical protein